MNGWKISISREPIKTGNLTSLLFVATMQAEDSEAVDTGKVPSAIRLTSECGDKTYKSILVHKKSRAQLTRAIRLITEN